MRDGKLTILSVVMILVITSAGALAVNENDEGRTRAETIIGHITSDEEWNSDVIVENIIIDEGVTVTVGAGVKVRITTDSFFYVDGTLIMDGTSAQPCQIECSTPGNTFGFIQVNSTGKMHFENFTIHDQDTSNIAFYHTGLPSILKNGIIDGGNYGFYTWNDGGDLIENVTIRNIGYHGLYIKRNTIPTIIKDITLENIVRGAICFEDTNGCLIDGMTADYDQWGIYTFNARNLRFSDLNLSGGLGTTGIVFVNELDNVHINDTVISGSSVGVGFSNLEGSTANFTRLRTLTDVGTPVQPFSSSYINAKIQDSSLLGRGLYSMIVSSAGPSQRIDLVNTTWDWERPIFTAGDVFVNVSWYLDGMLYNGNREPINGSLNIYRTGTLENNIYPISGGRIGKIEVRDRDIPDLYNPGNETKYYTYDLEFEYEDNTEDVLSYEDVRFDNYTIMLPEIDLRPTNTMPESITLDEDETYYMDLDNYFFDPEGSSMDFSTTYNVNLSVDIDPISHILSIEGSRENWHGSVNMNITASDGNHSTYADMDIEIIAVNDLPEPTGELPILEIEEDAFGYFNFTGFFEDVEDDPIEIYFQQGENYTISYNVSTMNLTVYPDENLSGMLKINFTVSDGIDQMNMTLLVNVKAVNDAPEASVMLGNNSADIIEYYLNETISVMVYDLALDEDKSLDFWIDAVDVDSDDLTFSFMEEDLLHGSIEVEVNHIEVIVNETSNETEMQNITVPMNFTYTPDPDNDNGDLVRFMVTDGQEMTELYVWFNVSSVNDPPVFDAPKDWNITVDAGEISTMDISSMISDVDGDELTITTSSSYITVNGTILEFLYTDPLDPFEIVTVNVSDGLIDVSADLTVNIDIIPFDDFDDDDEPALGKPKVTGKEEKWVVEIEGSEGQELWVVVEDSYWNKVSYKMAYTDGKYTAEITRDNAEEGLDYWISDREDGEPIDDTYKGTLPELKEEGSDDFPVWMIILVIIIILLIIVILALLLSGGKKDEDYLDEE